MLARVRQKGAELTGRRHEPGLLLLADLRHLHRTTAGVAGLGGAGPADAKVKETAAQVMVTG